MKNIKKLVSVLLFSIVYLFFSATVAFAQQTSGELYEKALYAEEVKGELQNAIDLYQQLLENNPENKQVSAKALLHQGMCYEKLGNQEAVKKYRHLVDNYPGQKNEVALAKERLSRLILAAEKVSKTPMEPKFTKIKITTNLPQFVALSPDGKNLALVSADKLWKMPLSGNLGPDITGIPEQINTEGVLLNDWSPLSWSLNGKWIAFNGNSQLDDKGNVSENPSIYVVSSDGGKQKKVIEINRDMEAINYHISL
ncbi:MAG: tetratricopeptide repeat protein, partial [Bacteroidales bacterium]|nr:tetratricopeptide repeat protein [Bacteroidales bacterium]